MSLDHLSFSLIPHTLLMYLYHVLSQLYYCYIYLDSFMTHILILIYLSKDLTYPFLIFTSILLIESHLNIINLHLFLLARCFLFYPCLSLCSCTLFLILPMSFSLFLHIVSYFTDIFFVWCISLQIICFWIFIISFLTFWNILNIDL